MSLGNDIHTHGYLAAKPEVSVTKKGNTKATFVIYSRCIFHGKVLETKHRCLVVGKRAARFLQRADRGKYVELRGVQVNSKSGEGENAQYYSTVLVEEVRVPPCQDRLHLEQVVEQHIDANNIEVMLDELEPVNDVPF